MHSTLESPGLVPSVEEALEGCLDVVLLDLLDGGGGRLLELLLVAAPLFGDASEVPFFLFSSSSTYWSFSVMEDFRLIRGRFVFDGDDEVVSASFAFAAFAAKDA